MFGGAHSDWPLYNCVSSPVLVGPHPKTTYLSSDGFSLLFRSPLQATWGCHIKKGR